MRKCLAPLAVLALAACQTTPASPDTEATPPLAAVGGTQARQGALDLLPLLDAKAGPAENLFYSPASIDQAFGLLHLGSAGATRVQLESVLPPPRDATGLAHKSDGVEVRLANALWLSDAFRFRSSYVSEAAERYAATAQRLDFAQPELVAKTVNAWADKATEGLIPQVLAASDVTPDAVAFLTNALYFDGKWQTEFDGWGEEPFLFGDGTNRPFVLMREVMSIGHASDGDLVAVRLPYRDARYAMDVVMPAKRRVMAQAPHAATLARIAGKLAAAKAVNVDVKLPRFEIEYKAGLVPTLRDLGLTLPFSDQADLSAMAEPGQQPLRVDDVQHLAKLQVFDTGTRAAAVTSVRIITTGARIYNPPPIPFTVDRPFMVVIRDLERGEILFLGRIADPQAFTPEAAES